MGMSSTYGAADWDECVATIHRALDLGVRFIDTANAYGAGHNEALFGLDITAASGRLVFRADPDYLKAACDASLLRLGVDEIDLYYLHRVSPATPIEESVGALADLVTEGKIRAIGLCEVDAAHLRAAHAVHPIAAVQSEYSIWS
jgi:aryl-alcohol dehydrogenase-like predicted oxidoreductase